MDIPFEAHNGFGSQDSSFSFELSGYFIVSRSVYCFDFNEIYVKCCMDILFEVDSCGLQKLNRHENRCATVGCQARHTGF